MSKLKQPKMNKLCFVLPLATLLLGPSCFANRPVKLDIAQQRALELRIIVGIKHYRLSPVNAAVDINYHSAGPALRVVGLAPSPAFIQAWRDAPNVSAAQVDWISQNGNLSFDVKLTGNLLTDHGNKTWYTVENHLVSLHGKENILNGFRMRTPDGKGGYTEQYDWSGSLNGQMLHDGFWDRYNQLDPRFFAYFVDGQGLDQLLSDRTYSSKLLGVETLYGCRCAHIEIKQWIMPQRIIYDCQCWVDLDHQFVVRKTHQIFRSFGSHDNSYSESTVPSLLKLGTRWLPAAYVAQTILPGITVRGKQCVDHDVNASIEPLPSTSELGKPPFTIRWPDGSYVRDEANGKVFLAQKDGTLTLVNTKDVHTSVPDR